MPLLSLDLERPTTPKTSASSQLVLNSTSVSLGLLPGRGLLYSSLLHEMAIFALLLWPTGHRPAYEEAPKQWDLTMIPKDALYLPQLGGGSSGGGSAQTPRGADTAAVAARSTAGVSYPGPQAIVSNPPNPTNRIQTILQPALPNPPVLKMLVPLPNVVKLAGPLPGPPPPAPEAPKLPPLATNHSPLASDSTNRQSAIENPAVPPAAPAPLEAPKLTLPPPLATNHSPLATDLTQPAAPPTTPSEPKPKPQVLPGAGGADTRSLLVLSPMPAPSDQAAKVPPGEARGQFAIAPLPNRAMSQLGPGSSIASATLGAVGLGTQPESAAADAVGAAGRGEAGAGAAGHGDGAVGRGSGSGAGVGPGAGRGSGLGNGSGTGAGTGPGTGAFPGMTIQGGQWGPGSMAGSSSREPHKGNEGSYGLTIVSAGNSGGGLGDFGVFYDEAVFTVYINMASSADDPAPSWTLQYAALHTAGVPQGQLVPPFPLQKKTPEWPPELVARYRGRLLVVYAVIDAEGKLQRLKMMQSPTIQCNQVLFAALQGWTFRPASVNGTPVAVKALLGVPIAGP